MDKNEFTKLVPVSSPNNHSRKNIAKRKSRWSSEVIQKKVKKEDCSDEMDRIEKEIREPSLFDLSLQIKELQEVKVKTEPKVLEDDLHPIEFTTFTCQTDMDIKQDSEDDKTEITNNGKEDTTSICDQLQTKLVTEPVEEDETVQIDLEEVLSSKVKFPQIFYKCLKYNYNFNELVPPYNCEEDGFPSCLFKTLYFDEYLKHVEAIHQINGLSSFSSEDELLRGAIMEGWLGKEVGPFQCRYCKKATVTHQEMGRHQAEFHAQEQCLFFYRKFVPNDTVTNPEQVNLEDSSFINHVIQLPDQAHLCNFKLTDVLLSSTSTKLTDGVSETSLPLLPKLEVPHDELEIFSMPMDNESSLLSELDPLCLDKKLPNDGGTHDDAILAVQLTGGALQKPSGKKTIPQQVNPEDPSFIDHVIHLPDQVHLCDFKLAEGLCSLTSAKLTDGNSPSRDSEIESKIPCEGPEMYLDDETIGKKCSWEGCYKTYHSQTPLIKHIEEDHVELLRGEKLACFWINCRRKSKPFNHKCELLIHMRIHSGEKPNKCPFQGCNRAFSTSQSLKRHQMRHTGEKPYLCEFSTCCRSFSKLSHKVTHQRIHDKTKLYACQVTGCSKNFTDPISRWKHVKNHTVDNQLKVKQTSVKSKGKEGDEPFLFNI